LPAAMSQTASISYFEDAMQCSSSRFSPRSLQVPSTTPFVPEQKAKGGVGVHTCSILMCLCVYVCPYLFVCSCVHIYTLVSILMCLCVYVCSYVCPAQHMFTRHHILMCIHAHDVICYMSTCSYVTCPTCSHVTCSTCSYVTCSHVHMYYVTCSTRSYVTCSTC
jgi:hypothetical protein